MFNKYFLRERHRKKGRKERRGGREKRREGDRKEERERSGEGGRGRKEIFCGM